MDIILSIIKQILFALFVFILFLECLELNMIVETYQFPMNDLLNTSDNKKICKDIFNHSQSYLCIQSSQQIEFFMNYCFFGRNQKVETVNGKYVLMRHQIIWSMLPNFQEQNSKIEKIGQFIQKKFEQRRFLISSIEYYVQQLIKLYKNPSKYFFVMRVPSKNYSSIVYPQFRHKLQLIKTTFNSLYYADIKFILVYEQLDKNQPVKGFQRIGKPNQESYKKFFQRFKIVGSQQKKKLRKYLQDMPIATINKTMYMTKLDANQLQHLYLAQQKTTQFCLPVDSSQIKQQQTDQIQIQTTKQSNKQYWKSYWSKHKDRLNTI